MDRLEQLLDAIKTLEAQRSLLGDAVVDAAVEGLKKELSQLSSHSLDGERKLVTVMFADLSGFSTLSATMDPEAVRDLVNRCFNALVPVIHKYGGTVDKFIGDEIMALFGAPVTHENDPERAMHAALELLQTIRNFNQSHDSKLDLHIGMNSGLVLAGGLGPDELQQYSVMGDTVNVAARLVSIATNGEIIVGPDTFRLGGSGFRFDALPPAELKGQSEPLPLYRLSGLKSDHERPAARSGLGAPLVGRDAHLSRMMALLEALRQGQGATVAVVGEAGLGKSRLVAEVARRANEEINWVEGRCLSYTSGNSFWLVQDILRRLARLEPNAPAGTCATQLLDQVSAYLGDRALDVYPYLARLLDLPLSDEIADRVQYLQPQSLQNRMQRAFTDLMRAAAQARPLVLVCEDLHWVDPSSLQLLKNLAPLTTAAPLLLILNLRPEKDSPAWAFHTQMQRELAGDYHIVEIEPLTTDDSKQLMASLVQNGDLPQRIRRQLLTKAEGNPFFLEEMIHSLLGAQDATEAAPQTSQRPLPETIEVPETLHGVIAARIDRLAPPDKELLQIASVIGRIFQHNILHHVLAQQHVDDILEPSLRRLLHQALLRRLVESESVRAYIFKHAITQEVTYNSLLIARRRQLHPLIAQSIETLFPDSQEELSATLAYHYSLGGRAEQSVPHLVRAAARAAATYANPEAITFYRQALREIEPLRQANPAQWAPTQNQIRTELGILLSQIGEYEEGRATLQLAFEDTPAAEPLLQARIVRHMADAQSMQRQLEEALQTYAQASALLEPPPNDPPASWWETWLDIELARAWVLYLRILPDEMTAQMEKITPAVTQHGTDSHKMKFYNALSLMHLIRSRWYRVPEEAIGYARRLTTFGKPAAMLYGGSLFSGLFNIGFIHLWREELDLAEENLREALQAARSSGITSSELMALTYLTVVFRMRGDDEQVAAFGARSLALAQTEHNPIYIAVARANLAWLALRRERMDEAREDAQQALSLFDKVQFPLKYLAVFPLLSLALQEGDMQTAASLADKMLASRTKRLPPDLTQHLLLGAGYGQEGQNDVAFDHLSRAVSLAQETGYF